MLWLSLDFVSQLRYRLLKELPGLPAQLLMAPPTRQKELQHSTTLPKIGAVMITLYQKNNDWHILLMRRTEDGGAHSGQISLPGGKQDANDGSNAFTALRELQEEMGIGYESIELLGALTPLYIPPSNFLITPIVCFWHPAHLLQPSATEVQSVLQIKLKDLFASVTKSTEEVFRSDKKNLLMNTPVYKLENNIVIWGATAMVLSELEALLVL
jgi:8-oxo-dGTP pyrophosphatase MutT (NUDIX family)